MQPTNDSLHKPADFVGTLHDEDVGSFERRKVDHLDFALDVKNEAVGHAGFDELELLHDALPELDFQTLTLSTQTLSQNWKTPFFVSSMTAGNKRSVSLNSVIAEACSVQQWPFAVGSQRRELFDTEAAFEWKQLRTQFPNVHYFGNLGLSQLIQTPIPKIQSLAEGLEARVFFIHTNALQEVLQKEGTPQFCGGLHALEKLCKSLNIPVVLKETGCGFSAKTLARIKNTGVAAVDVSGFGGTHWGRIEGARHLSDSMLREVSETFAGWGISTVQSLLNARLAEVNYEVWASGGIRNGLDAAKALALGASAVGFAKPVLENALVGSDQLIRWMQAREYELKVALFCTGMGSVQELREKQPCRQR